MRTSSVVAGIDVGGKRKGYHAVALAEGKYADALHSCDATEVAAWCGEVGATAVGIDAPCTWSATGRARPAERELMEEKIWCFSSPTRAVAIGHPKNNYGWMLAGETLYAVLKSSGFSFLTSKSSKPKRLMFETFPHAVVCALRGEVVPANNKATVRRAVLADHGIVDRNLTNIDLVDAALCALTAHHVLTRQWRGYGNIETGLIVVPN